MPDFNLNRFVEAQNAVLDQVRLELAAGRKRSHWMWFVFPQLAGLGRSMMARRYALSSLAEAEAYLEHPLLGPRLIELTGLVNNASGHSITEIFGSPDDLKFHSSMTLFAHAAAAPELFVTALTTYFDGKPDQATLQLLSSAG